MQVALAHRCWTALVDVCAPALRVRVRVKVWSKRLSITADGGELGRFERSPAGYAHRSSEKPGDLLDGRKLWKRLYSHRRLTVSVFAATMLAGLLYLLIAPPVYTAVSVIHVDPRQQRAIASAFDSSGTGADAANVITASDITAMKDFMDNGYSLFLSATSGLRNIQAINPNFLTNYFGAEFNDTSISVSNIRGVPGSELGDSSRYNVPPSLDFPPRPALRVVSGGEGFLTYVSGRVEPSAGISYRGSHNSVLISFPVDAIVYQLSPSLFIWPVDTLINRVIDFFDPVSTGFYDDNPLSQLPESFELNQNFPNPFNPSTTISYTIRSRGNIGSEPYRTRLDIFNVLGRKVKTLVDKVQSPGTYTIEWRGETDSGSRVASGIYFYRLILGTEIQTKKMMLLK